MSAFDPQAFLDAQTNEANEKRPTIPAENPADANGLFTAVIGEIKTDSGTISKGDNAGNPWISMIIPLKLQIPAAIQALGLPAEFQVTDRVFLDLTPQGGLDNSKGKNRGQRTYREATGMNKPGETFAWRMLTGKIVKVKIAHELYNGNIVEKVAQILPA
ncbi:hypothetical protein UFOVP1320_45 [uncultured Caudovirales phage]|jgi:hypothetical protein|uniref:Uncharacterized protein n=1 Tax=uncultured Caudovirales phage TaxID=2100421 RepID=A0A6J5RWN7_9CAUD|nr:hypothetical protein UFOVP548_3 [uncultured Caudovirales phage]CAB4169786.1 hypothetical protein UFOVP904_3 [uncultured Caudovirales phage]CAB4182819.1 hypothetical protein UFOVP1079_41 [uncultured Caudovirales phage]CAB4198011.1 hypothetical protein UFOVP1320_45 [uncultured Caudovirales phage]CAB4211653.1 hypothetical protein UFOVP1431_10 [uncultured Caudovirales phage]